MANYQSPSSTPRTPGESNVSFALPLELRTKIFKCLLIADTRLSFKPLTTEEPDDQPRKFALNNANMATQFHVLCSVSKQTRADAREIFFAANKWCLEISFRRRLACKTLYMHLNTLDLIARNWGGDVIPRFKDVVLHLESGSGDTDATIAMLTESERLVLLPRGWKIEKFEIF
jgi:hypothetical protein